MNPALSLRASPAIAENLPVSIPLLCCSSSFDGGGSERQLWQLASGISRRAFSPSVYLLHRRGPYLDRLDCNTPVYDYFSSHQESLLNKIPGQIHRRQVAHLTATLERARTQVVYDRTYHLTLLTAPACRSAKVARVSVIVSPPSQDFENATERFKWQKRRQLRAAYADPKSLALAVSDAVARDAENYFRLPAGTVRVVPSPIDIESVGKQATEALPEVIKQAIAPEQWGRTFCVVGRMSAEKGQRLAIAALAKLVHRVPDARLILVGDGPMRQSLIQQAEQLGVSANVVMPGFVANPYPIIQRSAGAIVPSQYEGLPNVILEAFVLGTPVIATKCSESVEGLLDEQRGTLVKQNDSEQLQQAMARLIEQTRDSPEVIRHQTDLARGYVKERHSLVSWLVTMEDLLKEQHDRFQALNSAGSGDG
ncbi:MAG TPA: hypothetical protein DDW52_27450 [Planctomycetaceae bacterium]|nr:hypothetical protein [Planctomycetaceae bacterium]